MFYIVKFVIPLAFFFFFKLIRSGSKDKKKKGKYTIFLTSKNGLQNIMTIKTQCN